MDLCERGWMGYMRLKALTLREQKKKEGFTHGI